MYNIQGITKSTLDQQICHLWELKGRLPSLREWCKTTGQTTNSSLNIQEGNQIYSNLQSYWRAPGYGNPAWLPTTIMSFQEDFGSSKALRHTNVLIFHDSFFMSLKSIKLLSFWNIQLHYAFSATRLPANVAKFVKHFFPPSIWSQWPCSIFQPRSDKD